MHSSVQPQLQPFRPDAPRDYVRLFSNGAAYGGSQVMVAELPGIMTDELGVQPIRAGFEAVILVAYDRHPKRPTGLLGTNNQLLLRAEIVERTSLNRVAMNALEDLAAARRAPRLLHIASWRSPHAGSWAGACSVHRLHECAGDVARHLSTKGGRVGAGEAEVKAGEDPCVFHLLYDRGEGGEGPLDAG